jgi:hypothetical protein
LVCTVGPIRPACSGDIHSHPAITEIPVVRIIGSRYSSLSWAQAQYWQEKKSVEVKKAECFFSNNFRRKKEIMSPEILLVRNADGYRVLHGHLHLASVLNMSNEAIVEASGEGKVRVVKTSRGVLIGEENQRLPLLRN